MTPSSLSVILPAHQEEAHILHCLNSVRLQQKVEGAVHELIVVANGCRDATAELARGQAKAFAAAGWQYEVIETPIGNKIEALNLGDAAAQGQLRVYLDADVVLDPDVLAALHHALDGPGARYAGARLVVPRPNSRLSRAYARFWQRLPFVADGVSGAGLFAVNAEGRSRWEMFPQLISDDGFARLNFAPAERLQVDARYLWPVTEGFGPLVRVRRRQDAGMAELVARYPHLAVNTAGDKPSRKRVFRQTLADPAGFLAYAAVALAVRMRRASSSWDRNR